MISSMVDIIDLSGRMPSSDVHYMYDRGTLVPVWERNPDTFRVTAEYPVFPPTLTRSTPSLLL